MQMLLSKVSDVLGVPVVTPEAVERLAHIHLDEILAFADKALHRELVDAQYGLLLLQFCHVGTSYLPSLLTNHDSLSSSVLHPTQCWAGHYRSS